MSDIIGIKDVQRASDEHKIVTTILIELLEKHKYMNNLIENFRNESELFSKCVGETRLDYSIVKLTDRVREAQKIEQSINKVLTELMVMIPDETKTLKGDD